MPSAWESFKEKLRPLKILASYGKIAREAEDEHGHVLAANLDVVKEQLRALEFQELSILGEIKKVGEVWGLARDMSQGRQLHVRAVKDPQFEGHYILGAHLEAHRSRPAAHLKGDSDHKKGGKLLRKFLKKTKLFKNRCVKLAGKWCRVGVDITLDRKATKLLYAQKKELLKNFRKK
jgi:hypothetical protein